MRKVSFSIAISSALAFSAIAGDNSEFFQAIRNGDIGFIKAHLMKAEIEIRDPQYRRGIEYLLSTQFSDGSWHVRSRAIKFQPYFENDFPFGQDQWISAGATAWAAMALSLSEEPKVITRYPSGN